MEKKEIFESFIKKFSKRSLIQNANKHKDSLKGFLKENLMNNYKLSATETESIMQDIMNYYNV